MRVALVFILAASFSHAASPEKWARNTALLFQQEQKAPSREQIDRWLEELDDDLIEKREEATQKLDKNFKHAKPQVEKRLSQGASPEAASRLNQILREGPRDPRARALEIKLWQATKERWPGIADKAVSKDEKDFIQALQAAQTILYPYWSAARWPKPPFEDGGHLLSAVSENLFENKDWTKLSSTTQDTLTTTLVFYTPGEESKLENRFIAPLKQLSKDGANTYIRSRALRLVSRKTHIETQEIRELLVQSLEDSEGAIVAEAIEGLAHHEIKEEKERVKAFAKHSDRLVPPQVFEYFKKLFPKSADAVAVGETILRNLPTDPVSKNNFTDCDHIFDPVIEAFTEWEIIKNYRKELKAIAVHPDLDHCAKEKPQELLEQWENEEK